MARKPSWHKWIRSSADRLAVEAGCCFDLAAAERVRGFFRILRHSKGQWAGQRFELLPWQWTHVVAPLFGWQRPDGTRRYRRAYIEIPKKNGKSTLSAGVLLYLLVADNEPGAEVYTAAADREQASIIFREAANMVEQSPDLLRRLDVVPSTKRIVFPRTRSFYKALSAEVPTKEGINAHAIVVDELHAQRSRELWDALQYACASRRQPLSIAITTAGYDRESICWEQHEYAQAILDGRSDDWSFLAFIAAASEKDKWTSKRTWKKANPSWGVTVREDEFAEECARAQASTSAQNSFRRYRLNQWTAQEVLWLDMDRWAACGEDPRGEVDPDALVGRPCWGGLDLATTTDMNAFVLLFPSIEEGEPHRVLAFFWVPEGAATKRERLNRQRYDKWIAEGLVTQTRGDVADYAVIRRRINELGRRFGIQKIACDPWNAMQLGVELEEDGFEIEFFRQGFASMNGPTKQLEAWVIEQKLAHGDNPVLTWMAGNVAVETDAAGNLKPSRKKSREKIDGIVSLIMAGGLEMAGEETADAEVIVL